MDDDGSKQLDLNEFCKGCDASGVKLSKDDKLALFKIFDKDKSGNIDFEEFLVQLRVGHFYYCPLFEYAFLSCFP